MKFGCFAYSDQIETVEELGYDSIELDLGEIAAMTEEEFLSLHRRVQCSKLGFEVFSGLLPLGVRFHEPEFDEEYWMGYVSVAAKRAAMLGALMIPFGAGKCRSIPDDCQDVQTAKDYVLQLVRRIAAIMSEHSIMLVVEPLGPANSNYINTIPEAVEFVKQVNMSNCLTMCDLRHMHKLNEDFAHIPEHSAYIRHAHIDYPDGDARLFPLEDDDYDYLPYISALHAAGYNSILTIEATAYTDFRCEAGRALKYLKNLELSAK